MNEKTREPTQEEKHSTLILGLTLSLRSMALDLLEKSQVEEARGLIDTIEALDAKTKGNVSAEEAKVFEQVLYELRMAVLSGPAKVSATQEAASDSAAPADAATPAEPEQEDREEAP